jgi:hypothetical protein
VPKYELRLSSGDWGGLGGTSREAGIRGTLVRIGSGVSTPDMSVEERLATLDSSSSDSDPVPGDSVVAPGGGGGTGRDSGARGVTSALGTAGTARSCDGGGGAGLESVGELE